MEISTIKVMYKPGKYEMIINESDFDENVHEIIKDEVVEPVKDEVVEPVKDEVVEPVKDEVVEPVKQNKTKSSKKTSDDELKALIGEE